MDLLECRHAAFEEANTSLEDKMISDIRDIFEKWNPPHWPLWFLDCISQSFRKELASIGHLSSYVGNFQGGNDRMIGIRTCDFIPDTDLNMYWRKNNPDKFSITFKYLGKSIKDRPKAMEIIQDSIWQTLGEEEKCFWRKVPIKRQSRLFEAKEPMHLSSINYEKLGEILNRMKNLVQVLKNHQLGDIIKKEFEHSGLI